MGKGREVGDEKRVREGLRRTKGGGDGIHCRFWAFDN